MIACLQDGTIGSLCRSIKASGQPFDAAKKAQGKRTVIMGITHHVSGACLRVITLQPVPEMSLGRSLVANSMQTASDQKPTYKRVRRAAIGVCNLMEAPRRQQS